MMGTKVFFGLAIVAGLLASCETDDVEGAPVIDGALVTLSSNISSISEDAGTAEVTASLSESTDADVVINLALTGSATGNGIDYNISGTSITITAGNLTGSVVISAVQDTIEEGNEQIGIAIASVTGATADGNQQLNITIEDDDVPLQIQILINEVLYDPSNNALDGDANGDGAYAQNEDEFIEFINLSTQTIDMGGYQIFDTEALTTGTPRHTIPDSTLVAPGKALVIFGGGTPTGSFGGAIVQTSTTGNLNLNNAGDEITLKDANGSVMVTFDIEPLSNNPNESYTRNPDITGQFEQHNDNTPRLFSPGTKVDGSSF